MMRGGSLDEHKDGANAYAIEIAEIVAEKLAEAVEANVSALRNGLAEELTNVIREAICAQLPPAHVSNGHAAWGMPSEGRGASKRRISLSSSGPAAAGGPPRTLREDVSFCSLDGGSGGGPEGSHGAMSDFSAPPRQRPSGGSAHALVVPAGVHAGERRQHSKSKAPSVAGSSGSPTNRAKRRQTIRDLTSNLDRDLLMVRLSSATSLDHISDTSHTPESVEPVAAAAVQAKSPSVPNSRSSKSIHPCLTDLRQAREHELIGDLHTPGDEHSKSDMSSPTQSLELGRVSVKLLRYYRKHFDPMPLALRLCGVLPWRPPPPPCGSGGARPCHSPGAASTWYRCAVLLLVLLSVVNCLLVTLANHAIPDAGGLAGFQVIGVHIGLLSDVAVVLGSALALLTMDFRNFGQSLCECIRMLGRYAAHRDLQAYAIRGSWWDLGVSAALWAAAVVLRARSSSALASSMGQQLTVWQGLHLVTFALAAFVLLAMANCVVSISRLLMAMVDTYCCEVATHRDLSEAVHAWNVLQAILRKASGNLELCFFTLQTTILGTVLLGATDIYQRTAAGGWPSSSLMPAALIVLGLLRIFTASAVTGKCGHVPMLINSLCFGCSEFDSHRQYVVDYITNSAAGFYVFDVRLTTALALKVGYVCSALAFGLVTRTLGGLQGGGK